MPKSKQRNGIPTLGPWVTAWIEKYLVHAEGDYFGQPFRFRSFQKSFVYEAFQLNEDGSRRYDRALLGLPKGNGKTELAAALSVSELAGPVVFGGWDEHGRPVGVRRTAPDIPIAAASWEQADLLFGAAKTMISAGPLDDLFECYDTEIMPKGMPGRLYRVAAVAGTNDGRRPTFFVADELHEWEGRKERVYLVLSNGRAKRANTWELSISTAGWDPESLLHKLCERGREGEDERLLYRWYEADPELDLDDYEQRIQAIKQANPAAGDFLSLDNIEARFHEIPEYEFRRYYLNQWHAVPEQWISTETWTAAADPTRTVAPGTRIALGFDGSYNQDSTALVACTVDEPHLFTVGVWDRPERVKEWTVPIDEVELAILDTCQTYDVVSFPADDTFGRIWAKELAALAAQGVPVLEWPTRAPSRMAPACGQLWGALNRREVTHDAHPQLTRHVMNCRTKTDRYGPRVVKEHSTSEKHIDAAVAGVIAYDAAVRAATERSLAWLL